MVGIVIIIVNKVVWRIWNH